ncbi:hypothetical protein [Veronia pacifica]|uniref:Uncharacterized protein n=1 Tax=Veronia pacifica TaxID=1080227 RepID=A0A1C3EF14_9GAMM|nr:hypothetical protein [Veronia pacifica]ODA31842.1 hypothetical protein A8L45_15230 [Veronia pacifica]
MRRIAMLLLSGIFSCSAHAVDIANIDKQCAKKNYLDYVSASILWYENLVNLTVNKHPQLQEVANWFLDGRRKHFTLNEVAFNWYLENDESRLNFNKSVESWLTLTQEDIRKLSLTSTPISPDAKAVFDFRQGKAHEGNYELRTALADLLSNPKEIERPLRAYNDSIAKITNHSCLK